MYTLRLYDSIILTAKNQATKNKIIGINKKSDIKLIIFKYLNIFPKLK